MQNYKKILVNKKSKDSFIYSAIKDANPIHETFIVNNNKEVVNNKFINLSSKKRGFNKRSFIGVLHRNAKWSPDYNGRSTDFLPNNMLSYGCQFNCSYCYVDRRDEATFPKFYDDFYKFPEFVESIMENIDFFRSQFNKICSKDFEQYRDKRHSKYVTFDIGCDSDCLIDNKITYSTSYYGHIIDVINQISEIDGAMTSFATKDDDVDEFISYIKNPKMCRIRASLMPENHRVILEMNTSKIIDRINMINKLVDAGFEVHINLSPIVVTESFAKEYEDLLNLVNDNLSQKAKDQMAFEIIFLTHAEKLFNKVSEYAPKAHNMMVNGPLDLVPKWNKPNVLSYGRKDKNMLKHVMNSIISEIMPYSRIRYMF